MDPHDRTDSPEADDPSPVGAPVTYMRSVVGSKKRRQRLERAQQIEAENRMLLIKMGATRTQYRGSRLAKYPGELGALSSRADLLEHVSTWKPLHLRPLPIAGLQSSPLRSSASMSLIVKAKDPVHIMQLHSQAPAPSCSFPGGKMQAGPSSYARQPIMARPVSPVRVLVDRARDGAGSDMTSQAPPSLHPHGTESLARSRSMPVLQKRPPVTEESLCTEREGFGFGSTSPTGRLQLLPEQKRPASVSPPPPPLDISDPLHKRIGLAAPARVSSFGSVSPTGRLPPSSTRALPPGSDSLARTRAFASPRTMTDTVGLERIGSTGFLLASPPAGRLPSLPETGPASNIAPYSVADVGLGLNAQRASSRRQLARSAATLVPISEGSSRHDAAFQGAPAGSSARRVRQQPLRIPGATGRRYDWRDGLVPAFGGAAAPVDVAEFERMRLSASSACESARGSDS